MAKELPYFRFNVSEWLNDDISMESYEHKGLFADVCAFYWFKDCDVSLAMLNKRFSNATPILNDLINCGIIKVVDDFNIEIKFLNTQYDFLSEKREKRSEAGRKGGLKKSSNATARLKQCSSYKDKDKDKDNNEKPIKIDLQTRKQNFIDEIGVFKGKYTSELLNAFFNYWTELNQPKTKMRFELEKTFEVSKRLLTWSKKEYGTIKQSNPKNQGASIDEIAALADKHFGHLQDR
jgi:general stress protein YciG